MSPSGNGSGFAFEVHQPTLHSLRLARASQAFLGTLPQPPELWEALALLQGQRTLLRCWLELRIRRDQSDSAAEAEASVLQKLEDVRRDHAGWMSQLRSHLSPPAGIPSDAELQEIAFALILLSPQARDAATRWIADPAASAEEISRTFHIARGYQKAMGSGGTIRREGSPGTAPPPAESGTGSGSSSGITIILPRGVKLETLEDVGRVDDCRKILRAFDPEVQLWECFCLVMGDERSRLVIDDMIRLKKKGSSENLADAVQSLFPRLYQIRQELGPFVKGLAQFLAELPVGSYSTDTREMALGFIVGSPVGRKHAEQWLSDPAHYRQEAATRFEGLVGRAMNYQTALRAVSES